MGIFEVALGLAAFLCSLVAGFLFAFAVVVMPGIGKLDDRGFLHAFAVMDRVIQNNQPIFGVVWLGSIAASVLSAVLGLWHLDGIDRLLLILAAAAFILGVQLPTFTINIPLNNKLQNLDLSKIDETTCGAVRRDFEQRWNRWNAVRTGVASLVSALLMIVLWRL